MSAPTTGFSVVRGTPTPEELAAVLTVLAAVRRAQCSAQESDPAPRRPDGGRWSGRTPWHRPASASVMAYAAGWESASRPAPPNGPNGSNGKDRR
ncbi:acyl-CoA carboxylase subunit epsilon [Streptomyces sp. NPDC086554]|uniref:acyl-CoA carboxylase subunit epsilon n=1 Tax=Streptomyces sp. NPDC086554 TaxID=3154864 RepID=UPI00341A3C36